MRWRVGRFVRGTIDEDVSPGESGIDHDAVFERARIAAALDAVMSEHAWIGWEPLTEPGISDVDGGRWERAAIRCKRCGQTRKVWKGIARDDARLLPGCPGSKREA